MANVRISIVTISFNCKDEIEETLRSVIGQSYENKEIIVVDGESTDGTVEVIEKYRDKIDQFISESDRGRSDAFNKGITMATGDFIVMINAGDLMTDDALAHFSESYVPGYDVIKGSTIRWNPESGMKSRELPVISYRPIPFNFYVCHQSSYISKAAYEKFGLYRLDFHIAMDFELMLRFTRQGARFMAIDRDLALFRLGGVSQSAGDRRYAEMRKAMELNGRNCFQTGVFMVYLHVRTWCRNLLNRINPDLKSRLMTKVVG